MAAPAIPPLVVPKVRRKNVGGVQGQTQTFTLPVDMSKQGLADIRWWLQDIIEDEVAKQERLNNPPQILLVDGTTKPIATVRAKIEVIFGAFLQRAVMVAIEGALHNAIVGNLDKVRKRSRGKLANIAQYWEWVYLTGNTSTILAGPQDLKTFLNDDRLILRPKLPYASTVSILVGIRTGQSIMRRAVLAVRNQAPFRSLTVTSGFTREYATPGEVSKYGTPFISVRVKRPRRRRR